MGSVRDRITAEQFQAAQQAQDAQRQKEAAAKAKQDAEPDFIPRASRSSLVVGNAPTMSTREQQEFREAQKPEVLKPSTRQGSSGAFTTANAPMTLREKGERQQGLQEIANTPENLRTAAAQFYLDQHNEEVAKQEQREREKAEQQARINAANEARAKENARVISIRLALTQVNATESERALIWQLISNRPEVTDEKVIQMIYALRDELAGSRPEWAAGF